MAIAFIPNPDNKPEINHLDENRSNNFVGNLEWCTSKENKNYGNHNKNLSKVSINNPKKSKPVIQYSLDGTFIKVFPSIKEAERQLGIPATSISRNCKHKFGVQQCCGYRWEYFNQPKTDANRKVV